MISYIAILMLGVILCTECTSTEKARYDGYKVIRAQATDLKDVGDIFHKYQVDVWRHPSTGLPSFDFMVSAADYNSVIIDLESVGANYNVTIFNVQTLIDGEREPRLSETRRKRAANSGFSRKYHKYDEIRRWMRQFARANSDIVRIVPVGATYRGRRIIAAKIGVRRNTTKQIMWQDGGIHSREWITGASLIWVMRKLVKDYRRNVPQIVRYLEEMDWYILPIWNIDGYKYSWTKDRMWRKSVGEKGALGCFGVDLNRNFETELSGGDMASDDACAEVYHGPTAFSSIESLSVSNFLRTRKGRIAAMITVHSYAQAWLYPYGYTYEAAKDYDDLNSLSSRAVSAISSVYGTPYKHGSVSEFFESKISGSSLDWSYDTLCAKYSFAVELRDKGVYGFLLPEKYIVPTATEYFAGLKVVADHVINLSRSELRSSSCR